MTNHHFRLPLLTFALAITAPITQAQGGHSATLTWTDTTNPAGTTYSVYRAPGLCTTTPVPTWAKVTTTPLTTKTWADTAVVPGNYCYSITATYTGLESGKSVPALASIPSFIPTAVSAILSGTKVTVAWIDTQNPAVTTTYTVYRAVGLCSGTPTYAKLATGLTAKSYDDPTPIPGSLCYSVSATDNAVESALAGSGGVSVPAAIPTSLNVVVQ
jgi:hypothetical protein